MLRAYKTELNPNNYQKTLFMRHAGVARFVFNWALADSIERHKQGIKTNVFEQKRRFNALKKDKYPWIYDTAYCVTEQAFTNVDRAFQNFFRRVKQCDKKKGFPKFKKRKLGTSNFTMRGCIQVEERRIKLPIIGWVRTKEKGYLPNKNCKILSANISEVAGRWYASLQVEEAKADAQPSVGPVIGIDMGINALATCSNGMVFSNPKTLNRYLSCLKRSQRQLSRRKKGGSNRLKSKMRVARLHAKIANVRKHALHQVSYTLTAKAKPSAIVLEDLNVQGMLQNRHLSRSIADAAWGELRRQLEYKCEWYGVDLIVANRFYPSSKTCSACGVKKPLLHLSEREFVCESCGAIINRDLNAAYNLANLAVKHTVTACGGDVRPALSRRSLSKQEVGGGSDATL